MFRIGLGVVGRVLVCELGLDVDVGMCFWEFVDLWRGAGTGSVLISFVVRALKRLFATFSSLRNL